MVRAATEKPVEPKQVWTRGTHSKLVSDERNVHGTKSENEMFDFIFCTTLCRC